MDNSSLPSGVSPALRFIPYIFPQRGSLIRVRTKPPKVKFPGVVLKGMFAFLPGLTQP